MKDARATRELKAFEAIQTADNDEQCFYALCEYFYFISANNDLKESLKSHFRKSGNDLYLGAGKELFKLLEDEKQTPMAVWGNVMRTLTGGGNKSLIMFTKPGAAFSVGRKIHQHLLPLVGPSVKNQDVKTKINIDVNGISLGSMAKSRYSISGRRKKLVWLLAQSDKPIRMKDCAVLLGVSSAEAFKIGGDKGDVNKNFRNKLGVEADLIQVVSGGYSLNDDELDISLSLT